MLKPVPTYPGRYLPQLLHLDGPGDAFCNRHISQSTADVVVLGALNHRRVPLPGPRARPAHGADRGTFIDAPQSPLVKLDDGIKLKVHLLFVPHDCGLYKAADDDALMHHRRFHRLSDRTNRVLAIPKED